MFGASDFDELQHRLYSGVIADILDELGLRNQAMDHRLRPLHPSFKMVGRAFTIHAADVYEIPERPYEKELEAIDALAEDDVVVANVSGSNCCGFWGELLSTAARVKGARGAVIDGFTRDSEKIIDMGFPVFARGVHPLDSKGRVDVIAYKVPVQCGQILVRSGDIVFADYDGIVVIPQEAAEEVFIKASEKVNGENRMRKALQEGMGVVEAYRKFGIL